MTNRLDSFASFELSSVTHGYRAFDLLTRFPSVKVIEASVIAGGRFWILAEGSGEEFETIIHDIRGLHTGGSDDPDSGVIDHEIIRSADRTVFEAIYSLAQHQLQETLIVVECETVSGLLAALYSLRDNNELQLIEAKIHRGSKPGGYGFVTGTKVECSIAAETARTRMKAKMRTAKIELIDAPNGKFREHFNFSGQA